MLLSFFFLGDLSDEYHDPIIFSGWSLFFEAIFYLLVVLYGARTLLIKHTLLVFGILGYLFPNLGYENLFFNQFYIYFFFGMNLDYLLKKVKREYSGYILFLVTILLLFVMSYNDYGGGTFIPRQFVEIDEKFFNLDSDKIYAPRIIFWGIPALLFTIFFIKYFEIVILNSWYFFIGTISYSIYLVHSLLNMSIGWFDWLLLFYGISYLREFVILILIFLILPLSFITYKYIEKPFINLRKDRLI
jgi:peptidoglycan/LPS O-acetylase OafA/YrhL